VVEVGMDFQDIYRNRRVDGAMMRLASFGQSPGERSESHGALDERLERISSMGSGTGSARLRRLGRSKEKDSTSDAV